MEARGDLVSHCISFCRELREHGLLAGPNETADSLRALSSVDILDRGQVYWALRTILVSRADEAPAFDDCFQRFWSFRLSGERSGAPPRPPRREGILRAGNLSAAPAGLRSSEPDQHPSVEIVRTGASAAERAGGRELRGLGVDGLDEVLKAAARIARALPSRPGRRLKSHRRKGRPDLREALHRNMKHGMEIVDLPRRRRIPQRPRLVVLLDVSGSMDRYAKLMLQVVYALGQRAGRVETFVFSTSLTRVTREMQAPTFQEALQQVGDKVRHWSGGTRIGKCLESLNGEHAHLLDRNTTLVLLSDGWDTGAPDDLAGELARLKKRVYQVVWLNPLLGTPDYQPLTMGLRAARPHVDLFASARSLEQIKRLPAHLKK